MKKVNYDDYLALCRKRFPSIRAKVENRFQKRVARERPYDEKKEQLLLRMDILRWEKALQSGEIERLGDRKWRLRLF